MQQHNQPAFFCPRTGVQEVIVDQRVDSVPLKKVVKVKFRRLLWIRELTAFHSKRLLR